VRGTPEVGRGQVEVGRREAETGGVQQGMLWSARLDLQRVVHGDSCQKEDIVILRLTYEF